MFTYEQHQMAFSSEIERDAFFARAHRGVKAGTAMEHVLGTNLGVWGDEHALRRDAAEIIKYELNTWAREEGERALGVPIEAIINNRIFHQAFDVCRRPNIKEIDRLVRSGFRDETVEPCDVRHYLDRAFLGQLYRSLCDVADKYQNAVRFHEEHLARIGAR